jgi:dolichyl-phosphate-mannose-protein mannosyltransferase
MRSRPFPEFKNAHRDFLLLIAVCIATVIVHFFVNDGYGFHRDELATLDDARHLDWGYVAYPPVTPFFGRVSLDLFGPSLIGFRLFAALASAVSIFLTGWIARELGGGRSAQIVAAAAATPFCLATGALMQYVAFDYLCWVLLSLFLARLCVSNDPRGWMAIGAAISLGLLTKYSMLFGVAGVIVGTVSTDLRHNLKTKWPWLAGAVAVVIVLPNLIWQVQHDFVSLDFLRHIHARDVRIGRTQDFVPDQLKLNLCAFPIAVIGLGGYFFSRDERRFRALGWFYVVPFLLFFLAQGRGYYLMPAYPVLYAGGAVWLERCLVRLRLLWRRVNYALIAIALTADVAVAGAVTLPLAPINSAWWRFAVENNDDLAEEIGWPELVETVARIRDSLSESDRVRLGIFAGNYGEAGAINLYGPRYGLPQAIGGTNSFWARGYGNPAPETVIVLGLPRDFLEQHFTSCEVVGQISNKFGVKNEETERHRDIFLCRGMREGWPAFWKNFRRYG